MRRHPTLAIGYISAMILTQFTLAACGIQPETPIAAANIALATPGQNGLSCEGCAQATQDAAIAQQKNTADAQAASTAEVMRVNAQATLNSANLTVSAALTQEQSSADFAAAQIAATIEIARAQAQATLNSAGSTQNAAQTQAQYDLLAKVAAGTQSAQAMLTQQNKNDLAAGTQTAIANTIATQSQSAAATSQWYTDQERQRQEERQGPLAFIWMWCLPIFIMVFAVLMLWGFWRWLKIQQANQFILENSVNKLQEPAVEATYHHNGSLPYLETVIPDNEIQLTTPDDEVHEWLDEVKDKLRDNDKKDESQ